MADPKQVEVIIYDKRMMIAGDNTILAKLEQLQVDALETQYKAQTDEFVKSVFEDMQDQTPEDLTEFLEGKVMVLPLDSISAEAIGGSPRLLDVKLLTIRSRIVTRRKKGGNGEGEGEE